MLCGDMARYDVVMCDLIRDEGLVGQMKLSSRPKSLKRKLDHKEATPPPQQQAM